MQRTAAAAAAAVLIIASCSSDGGAPAAAPSTLATSPSTTATSTPAPTTTDPAPPPTGGAEPGDTGVGDPYFPGLGNPGFDVDHYTIELAVDPVAGTVAGSTTVDLTATEDRGWFTLDFAGLEVGDVRVDGTPAAHRMDGQELVVDAPLAAGEAVSVSIAYSGIPDTYTPDSPAIPMGWIANAEGTFVASEPAGAHWWYPCSDHPSDKATYTFRITAPEGYTAAANGELVETAPGDGTTTYVWEMTDPMATYLATVVVAPLDRVDHPPYGSVTLRDYLPPGTEVPDAFRLTGEMLGVMEGWFGPYPFGQYGHVLVSGFPAALETQTLTVFGDEWLESSFLEFVVVHELAHQWYGDNVGPATWRDVWLNEGFATYAELLWVEHLFGPEAMQAEAARRYEDLTLVVHAVTADPGPARMFGISTYQRGGLTLHALRAEVGDDMFFEILRAWTREFGGGTADTADFVALAQDVAGADLEGLFDAWLYSEDLPPLPTI
jgi:aminopeptidase N